MLYIIGLKIKSQNEIIQLCTIEGILIQPNPSLFAQRSLKAPTLNIKNITFKKLGKLH